MTNRFEPVAGTPAGWYPIPGGGQRYWDGNPWVGNPLPPAWGEREASNPTVVNSALKMSFVMPLIAVIRGARRLPVNARDGGLMMAAGLGMTVTWVLIIAFAFAVILH